MSISFNQIPNNLRVPLFYAEFDNSGAVRGGATQEYRVLLIGNKLAAGTALPLSVNRISSMEQAIELFGAGSILANMCARHLAINKIHALYAVPMNDNGAGVAAAQTAAQLATALAAAINANTSLPVSAAVNGTNNFEVDLTAKNKGEHGNEIDVRHSHYEGQYLPAGVAVTITPFANGAGNPDVSTVWPVIGDLQYILLATPWTDTVNMGKVESELGRRSGPLVGSDGYAIYGKRGTFGALTTYGAARNSQYSTVIGVKGPNSPWIWAAEAVAQIALSAANDPARPFQTLPLKVIAPKATELFTLEERNQLLYSGISTFFVDAGGVVLLETIITTFQKNSFGSPDTSYLALNTPLTLSYLRFDLKARITSRFPRHKLANDGTKFAPGQAVVTPNSIKAEIITKFREWEEKALVEGFDQFKSQLIVERNKDNPNRVDVLMPPDLVNQLSVLGVKIQFLL